MRLALVVVAIFCLNISSTDAAYPNSPIRLVLPFPPGGGTDAFARILGPRLSEVLGAPVIVDNRPGASGNVAAEIVARAQPNGHTLLMGFSTVMTTNRSLFVNLSFDPIRDFEPIIQMATAEYFLVVNPTLSIQSVADLVSLAKTRPGKLNYASAGIASPLHLAGELLKSRASIDIVHIPYKGGGAGSVALMTNEVQLGFTSVASSVELIKSGRLKALAITGPARSTFFPDLLTMREAGFPDFQVTAWHALFAPTGTPSEIILQINHATSQILKEPEIIKLLHKIGYEPTATSPQELAAIVRTESEMWSAVIREAGIRGE